MKSKINRRDFLRSSAVGAAGFILASCAPAAAPKTEEKPAEEAPKEQEQAPAEAGVYKVSWWGESPDDPQKEWLQKNFIDTFNAAHKDAQIEYTFQEDLDRVLRTAVQAGAAPDILVTPGPGYVLEYVNAGYPAAMDKYADLYQWKTKLLPWAYETGMVNGKLYSLPLTYESMIVFYNKTLFDQKGWKIPTNRAEFEAIAEDAKKNDIYPISYGNSDWKPNTEHLVGMIFDHAAGPDNVYKALMGEKKWTDDEFVYATNLLNDWFQNGYFSGSIDNYHALTWDDFWPNLASGKGAMVLTGTWGFQGAMPAFEESGQEWDWFPMPPLAEGLKSVYALAIGTTLSLNSKAKDIDKAALALDWVVNDPKRAVTISSGFDFGEWMVPIHITADMFPADTDKRIARFYEEFAKETSAGNYGYTTWTFWPAKTEVLLYEEFDEILAGTVTVEQYLADMQKQFDEEFKDKKTPPVPKRG